MPQNKRVTLHPLLPDGTPDQSVNLYPKTLVNGIVDSEGNEVEVQEELVSGVNIKTINGQSIVGSGNIDTDAAALEDYYTKEETNTLLGEKVSKTSEENKLYGTNASGQETIYATSDFEHTSNKVTSLSDASTDTQYPSAKCVFDIETNLREIAEGKCKAFGLSYAETITSLKQSFTDDPKVYLIDVDEGYTFDNPLDISSAVVNGDYDSIDVVNSFFNSNNDYITLDYSKYLIVRGLFFPVMETIGTAYIIKINKAFNLGDIVLVYETDVADRWFGGQESGNYRFYKMETAKVDLSNYVTLNSAQTITGAKTFNGPVVFNSGIVSDIYPLGGTYNLGTTSFSWNNLYLGGKAYLGSNSNTYIGLSESADIYIKSAKKIIFDTTGDDIQFNRTLIPSSNNTKDIGSSSYAFKDLYLGGKAYFGGTNNYIYKDSSNLTVIGTGGGDILRIGSSTSEISTNFRAQATNTYDLGDSSHTWKDIYYSNKIISGNNYLQLNNTYNNIGFYMGNNLIFDIASNGASLGCGLRPRNNNTYNLGSSSYIWSQIYVSTLNDGTNSYSIAESMAQFNPNDTGTTEIKWTKMLSFSVSANTTFTFETAKTVCLNEYKAIITNSGASAITLTFTGVSNILSNDDTNLIITNATDSTIALDVGVTIECSIVNGKMVAINFEAQ